jgi:hypothetical protein
MSQAALAAVAARPRVAAMVVDRPRARRPAGNDFSPPMPSQVGCARGHARTQPQRLLMLAVLRTALEDCAVRFGDGGVPARRPAPRARRHAIAFIFSTDRRWPFSFENICDAIGIDAERLRRRVSAGT